MAYQSKYEKASKDIYQELTDNSIKGLEKLKEAMENNDGNWSKKWVGFGARNLVTDKKYNGINKSGLGFASLLLGHSDRRYATFNQVKELEKMRFDNLMLEKSLVNLPENEREEKQALVNNNWKILEDKGLLDRNKMIHVKKGSTGLPVYSYIEYEIKDSKEKTEQEPVKDINNPESVVNMVQTKKGRALKQSGIVFNVDCIENIGPEINQEVQLERYEEAKLNMQALINKTGLKVEHIKQDEAFYSPVLDKVVLPLPSQFRSEEDYWDTANHELVHATGSKNRLDRDTRNAKFGNQSYAFEELVAEIGSLFMSEELGIPHELSRMNDHAKYVNNWIEILKNDKYAITVASALAQKSVDYQNETRETFKRDLGISKEKIQKIKLEPEIVIDLKDKNKEREI